MTEEDYYDILGINKDADQKTIKEAYNKMLFTYHPDPC
jgi:molecular chaperone DnaJ